MARDFNVAPWFDDFDATKNYHRILFKPGFAVQARELTQAQTILQDQITKFGSSIFADGSKVSGGNIFVNSNITTCKLLSDDNIESFKGLYAVGDTSKIIAQVFDVDISNYYIITKPVNVQNATLFASGETINFYSSKLQAIASLNGSVSSLYTATAITEQTTTKNSSGKYLESVLTVNTTGVSVGDFVTISSLNFTSIVISVDGLNQVTLNKSLPSDFNNVTTTLTSKCSVKALEVGVDEGVWFSNGYFVYSPATSIVPDSINLCPSTVVGFNVLEETIDSFDDTSLLDPAIGASNYQAPGADRYKVYFEISKKPYTSDQTVADLSTVKFIELIRINKGVTEDVRNTPVFTEVSKAIARSVYDQSGNFIVNPFSLVVSDSRAIEANCAASISSGKVYFNGSAVEHIAPTNYYIEKARDTASETNISIESYYGNYVQVANVASGIVNFQTGSIVNLYNSSQNIIGSAKIRNLAYNSGVLKGANYNAYLFDVKLTSDNETFANVSSIGTANFISRVVNPQLVDNNYNSLIFPYPQNNISTVSNINYVTTRVFSSVYFNNGTTTINTDGYNEDFFGGSGVISGSVARQYYIVVVKNTNGSKYVAGQFVPMDDVANVSIDITNSSVSSGQAVINIGGTYSGTADIYATISITSDAIRNKSLVQNHPQLLLADSISSDIDIGVSDVYAFKGIFEVGTSTYKGTWNSAVTYAANEMVAYGDSAYLSLLSSNQNRNPSTTGQYWRKVNNTMSNYVTDNGQRDSHYDHATIRNVSGSPKGYVVVIADYFTHSGGKGPITVGSYASIDYSSIPTYVSKSSGKSYNLRDVLDFRPRRTDGLGVATFDTFQIPAPLNNPFSDYSYYLNRIDKIMIKSNGQFKTKKGIPSYTNPVEPVDDADALTLFTLNLKAYTFSKKDIIISPTNLRRYTMKDIGILDKRLTNIEYYTALSLLEKEVTGSDITDSTGTQLLFKNGFLVDSFSGQSVADVDNPDYLNSIDPVEQISRPSFTSFTEKLNNNLAQGSFITSPGNKTNNYLSVKNNIVTFSYNQQTFVNQNVATQIVNVNPFNVSFWAGAARLTPSSDTWYDDVYNPIITSVNEDQAAWLSATRSTGFGTQWNDWQFNWSGQNQVSSGNLTQITRDAQAISNVLTTKGLRGALTGGNIVVSSTSQVINTSIIPYARSIPIRFDVTGLPPYTIIHTFVNRVQMDYCVTPDSGSSDGIYKIDVVSGGSGYPNGNNQSIVQISGTSSSSAVATADVVGGSVKNINIISPGSEYIGDPSIYIASANTTSAVLKANTTYGGIGGNLRTDKNGHATGTILLPCNEVAKFPSGSLIVEFSDDYVNPTIGNCYAKSVFYSQGTLETLQTNIVSTRPPISTPAVTQPTVIPSIETGNTSPDLSLVINPIDFYIQSTDQADVNTSYTSATTPVYGLPENTSVTISASGGLVDAGGNTLSGLFATSKTVTTSNTGALLIAAKGTSSINYNTPKDVVLQLGNIPVHYTITTKVSDSAPDQFTFTPSNNVEINTTQTTSNVTVSGLSPNWPVNVSVTGGSFDAGTSAISGTWKTTPTQVTTSGSGTLVIAARGVSSNSYSTVTSVGVTVGSVSANYIINTKPASTSANAFSFTAVTDAEVSTPYASETVTISGVSPNYPITLSVVGGSYKAGTSTLEADWRTGSSTVTSSANGTLVVAVSGISSTVYSTRNNVTLTVGSTTGVYSITTKQADLTPAPFYFNPTNGVDVTTIQTSDATTITGLSPNYPVRVSVGGGGSYDAGTTALTGSFLTTASDVMTSSAGTLVVAARGTSSSNYANAVNIPVTVGTGTGVYTITTQALSDITPDNFVFTPVAGAEVNTVYTANTLTVTGLTPSINVRLSVSGGYYDANTSGSLTGVWKTVSSNVMTSGTGTIVVAAKGTSNTNYSTPQDVVVTVGTISSTYTITTKDPNITPSTFSFGYVYGKSLNSTQTSNTVTITGLSANYPVSISVEGGSYDVGTSALTGVWKTAPTTVTTSGSGTLVAAVRGTASSEYSTSTIVKLNVGAGSGSYSITTRAPLDLTPTSFSFSDVSDTNLNVYQTTSPITVSGLEPNYDVAVSASGGLAILNGNAGVASGTVRTDSNGQFTLALGQQTSSSYSTSTSMSVTVGTFTTTWNAKTKAYNPGNPTFTINTPFANAPGVEIGYGYESEVVSVTGITPGIQVSVSCTAGGIAASDNADSLVYQVGAGRWGDVSLNFATSQTVIANASGVIYFRVRSDVISAYDYVWNSTVTVNGVSRNWIVRTVSQPAPPAQINLGIWANDNITTQAQTLTFNQGVQKVKDMFWAKGGAFKVAGISALNRWSETGYGFAKSATGRTPPRLVDFAGIMTNAAYWYGLFLLGSLSEAAAINGFSSTYTKYLGEGAITAGLGRGFLDYLRDPLSQNFFIPEGSLPNGAFISSVDLFFATKDPLVPVTIRIKPVVNGYPDAINDIPGTIVTKNPDDINVPATADIEKGIGLPTNFVFDHPIYLPAGQYSIMVSTNSNEYQVYASKQGQVQYGTNNVVSSVTYAGAFFKSQNSQTWIAAGGETLCFTMYICDFAGGSSSMQLTSNTSSSLRTFDILNLNNRDMLFNNLDSITYSVKTRDYATGILSDFINITPKQNFALPSRQKQVNSGDLVVKANMVNTDRWTSPVIDLERLYPVMINNLVDSYSSDKTTYESNPGFRNGGAISKYISKRVTLANNFDSSGLTVNLDINRPAGTSIEVYYKVLNANDPNNFDDQPYHLMSPIFVAGNSLPNTGPNEYTTDTYQALNITYNDIVTGYTYNNFKIFSIKICYYTDNTTSVPTLKNLRVVATA